MAKNRQRRTKVAPDEQTWDNLAEYLDTTIYVLVAAGLLAVSFAFSLETFRPYDAIKRLLFHAFSLVIALLLVARFISTAVPPVRRNAMHGFVLLFLLYNTGSFFLSGHADTVYYVDLVLLIIFFFGVAVSVNSESRYRHLLYIFATIVSVSAIYAFFQSGGYDYHEQLLSSFGARITGKRVFSFFANPSFFSAFLVFAIPLILSGLFIARGRSRYFFLVALFLGIVSLILTGSRAGALAGGVAVSAFFLMTQGHPSRRRFAVVACLLATLGIAGSLFSLKGDIPGLQNRQFWWQTAVKMAQDNALLGTGPGTFNVYYPTYRKKSEEIVLSHLAHEIRLDHAHNEFLEILTDLGIVGFALFIGILVAFVLNSYRHWDSDKKYLIAGNVSSVAALLVDNCFSVSLRFVFVAIFFWFGLAAQSGFMPEAEDEKETRVSAPRFLLCLSVVPLLFLLFWNHSLGVFKSEYYVKYGNGLFNNKDYRRAEYFLERALEYFPKDKLSLYHLGFAQYRLRKYEEARATLRRLVELDPNFLQVHYWLGNSYLRTDDLEAAKQQYEETLKLNDIYGPAYYALALIFLEEGKVEQAVQYLERAYAIEGDRSTFKMRLNALDKLIEVHYKLGNVDKVKSYAQQRHELGQQVREMAEKKIGPMDPGEPDE